MENLIIPTDLLKHHALHPSERLDTIWPLCSVAVKVWLIGPDWKDTAILWLSNLFQLLHRQGFWLTKIKMTKSSEKIVTTTQNNTFTTTLQRERMIFLSWCACSWKDREFYVGKFLFIHERSFSWKFLSNLKLSNWSIFPTTCKPLVLVTTSSFCWQFYPSIGFIPSIFCTRLDLNAY